MQMEGVRTSLNNQTESLRNNTAIQPNSMRKWLDELLDPISAKGFPRRVKDFWRLVSDPTTLTKLARHYLVQGWDR